MSIARIIMLHSKIPNLDSKLFLRTFLEHNTYDEKYLLKLNEESTDYVHYFLKSIKYTHSGLLLDSDEDVYIQCCVKTQWNTKPVTDSTIIYLNDNDDMCTFTMELTPEQYMYKEYGDIKNLTICPLKEKYCINIPSGFLHGYGYYNNKTIQNENISNVFCEIQMVASNDMISSMLSYKQNKKMNTYSDNIEQIPLEYNMIDCADLPYFVNTLLYKHVILSNLELTSNLLYKVGDYKKQEHKSKLDKFMLDINLQNYQGTNYMHIGYLNNFYPVFDCEWVVRNNKNKTISRVISHIAFYVEKVFEKLKQFYGLQNLLNLTDINIDVIQRASYSAFFEKQSNDLFYIIIQITKFSNSVFKTIDGISYNLNPGSVLFYPKNTYLEYEDDQCRDTFVVVRVFYVTTK